MVKLKRILYLYNPALMLVKDSSALFNYTIKLG